MAGIGFLLRKLATRDDFSGIIRAFFHSSIVAVGPWIMVVLCMAFITGFSYPVLDLETIRQFQSVLIYNFFFSFILASPLYMLSARYVADCLYAKNPVPIPGILICSLSMLVIAAVLLATPFYVFYAKMSPFTALLSIINFILLAKIWIVMLYLSSIRDFRAITICWLTSVILACFLSIHFGKQYGVNGLLGGVTIGLIFLLFSQEASILAEYPYRYRVPQAFGFYFRKYKQLFWSGLFLFSGMWIDKILMWSAPEAITYTNNLRTYPIYDSAMFLSYLSIAPGMGLFIFSLETNFYDAYIRYIQHIERNAPLSMIKQEENTIVSELIANGRIFLILQGSITLLIIALSPTIFQWAHADFLELGIFRLGTLGAFFTALVFFIVIIFSYFDSQSNALKVSLALFLSNTVFTLVSQKLGFMYYGLGYCLSAILTFLYAGIVFTGFLKKLTYHIFITNTIKRLQIKKPHEDVRL